MSSHVSLQASLPAQANFLGYFHTLIHSQDSQKQSIVKKGNLHSLAQIHWLMWTNLSSDQLKNSGGSTR